MSQAPASLNSSVSIKGQNTSGQAAYMAGQKAARDLAAAQKATEEVANFNAVFGYTQTSNYGFGQNYAHETSREGIGNSCIHLVTYDATDLVSQITSDFTSTENFSTVLSDFKNTNGNDTYLLRLVGLLEELPEISFSYDFTEGPGSTAQDKIGSFLNNDAFNLANAIGSVDSSFKNIINTGLLTNEMWNGVKNSDIKLKFKIYTSDPLGQTDPDVWIKALSLFATPYTGNQGSIRNYVKNLISGVKNIAGVGQSIFNASDILDKNKQKLKDEAKNEKRFNDLSKSGIDQNSEMYKMLNRAEEAAETLYSYGNEVAAIADTMSDILTMRYDTQRVTSEFNRVNCLGEKLWALYIYNNFLFKHPLTVYIKNWSVKPSQETNVVKYKKSDKGDTYAFYTRPVYYEFTVVCSLDQTYSIDQWNSILQDNLKLPSRGK